MKTILKFVSAYKSAVWIALGLMGVELFVELVQPLLMARIIDEGVMRKDLAVIVRWGGVLLLLSLAAFASGIINSFYAARVSQGVGHDVRRDLFENIQRFSYKHFQTFSTTSLMTRLTNDVTQIQNLLFMGLRIMLRAPLFMIGGIVLSFFVHARLALILLLSVPVLLAIMFWILTRGFHLFRRMQEKLDGLNTVIRENLVGMRLIKSYHRGEHEKKRFFQVNTELSDDSKKAFRLMALSMPVVMFGMNLCIVIILWFGFLDLESGRAQAGEIVAIINYATRIIFSFSVFTFLLTGFSRGKASASRIARVLQEDTGERSERDGEKVRPIRGHVCFENVSFSYPGSEIPVLQDISFRVRAGETVGVLGETGSGKSSLVQLIPRLFEVTAGRILIDGMDTRDMAVKNLRETIGLVPQEAHLFSGTVRENIAWGNDSATLEEIMEAAREAEIHDFIMTLPLQYETRIGQKGVNFSGGQKQRLSIARALVRRPRILLLDDSTSALDARTEHSILQTLKKQKCTTFIIAQKISSVREADQILLLHQGRLVASGTHETLLSSSDHYRSICRSQTQEEVV